MPREPESVHPAAGDAPPVRAAAPPFRQLELRQQWLFLGLALAVLLASLLLQVDHEGHVVLPLLRVTVPASCSFRRLAGHDCPGCGLTRSFISLAHGQWRQAWQYNPAGPLWFGLLLAQLPYRGLQIRRLQRGQSVVAWPVGNLAVWIGVAVLLGQWVWRMAEGMA